MIGRVGRDRCTQLRGFLHSLEIKLELEEMKNQPSVAEISKIKQAIADTMVKLEENGCE